MREGSILRDLEEGTDLLFILRVILSVLLAFCVRQLVQQNVFTLKLKSMKMKE
ncbi:UNVERIFIED_CONTAM: hypothetical protein GTU68_030791 [Idotea baltica]|nr:hypothetical protein [Idotea baltica]